MGSPRLSLSMLKDVNKHLEWTLSQKERYESHDPPRQSIHHVYDSIARSYFYLGNDDLANPFFIKSIKGAKAFYEFMQVKWRKEYKKPYEDIDTIYHIARPLWWIGDNEGAELFDGIIQFIDNQPVDQDPYRRARSLLKGVSYSIILERKGKANDWLSELKVIHAELVMQKWYEILEIIINTAEENFHNIYQDAFNRLGRLMRLDGATPVGWSPSYQLIIFEWLRRKIEVVSGHED